MRMSRSANVVRHEHHFHEGQDHHLHNGRAHISLKAAGGAAVLAGERSGSGLSSGPPDSSSSSSSSSSRPPLTRQLSSKDTRRSGVLDTDLSEARSTATEQGKHALDQRGDPLGGKKTSLLCYLIYLAAFLGASLGARPTMAMFHQNAYLEAQLGIQFDDPHPKTLRAGWMDMETEDDFWGYLNGTFCCRLSSSIYI